MCLRKILVFLILLSTVQLLAQEVGISEVEVGCINVPIAANSYVFNSAQEMTVELTKIRSPHPACGELNIKGIDFIEYSVIGMRVNLGGCKKAPDLKPYIASEGGKTVLTIFFKEYGNCRRLFQSYHWFKIPKTNKNNVVFKLLPNEKE